MKRNHQSLVAATAGLAALSLAACSGGDASPTPSGSDGGEDTSTFTTEISGTVNGWAYDNADDVGQARIDFAADELADSGVTIELDQSAFDAQKFTTRVASGDIPDVVQINRGFVATYAAQGLIRPLDECFATWGVDPTEYWYPQVIDDVRYDGKIYAVPQFYQPPAILLNTRVMDAAGVAKEDLDTSDQETFLSAVEAMTQMDGDNPTVIGFDPQAVNKAGLWLLSFGGKTINEDGSPALDDPKNVEAIEFLKKVYDLQGGYANAQSYIDSFDVFGDNNMFVADQVGAEVFDQWYPNVLTSYADQVEISAIPVMTQSGEPFTVASGTSFMLPANSENPAAACAWAISTTSLGAWEAAGNARGETTANDPGRNGINTGLFTGSPEADELNRTNWTTGAGYEGFQEAIDTYYEVALNGQSFGSSPVGQQIESELKNAMTAALLGEKTPEQALSDAQTAAQRAYDQVG